MGAKNSAQGLKFSASVDLDNTVIHTLQKVGAALNIN